MPHRSRRGARSRLAAPRPGPRRHLTTRAPARRRHEGEFLKAGGTKAQLAALREFDAARHDAKLFDEAEQTTLALTYEMTREIAVTPATMKRVRAVLPDAQVVELVGTIAGYNMVSRFVVATGVELE